VYGDRSCAELEQFVHCRNCPDYAHAAAVLLDRALPAEYRREWTDHFSAAKKLSAAAHTAAVVFRVGAEWLALPAVAFQEVAERRQIHSLPHRRHGLVLGLANVRGELLICVSLGHLLCSEKLPLTESLRANYRRLLVATWEDRRFGFPVEEVQGPHRFDPGEVQPPPATVARSSTSCISGVIHQKGHPIGLLDPPALFAALNGSLT
jgi:chemotaxis-related protein WspD